jgi:hypothetical protein
MNEQVQELVDLLRWNRYHHGRAWRKVRVDRLGKCFPAWSAAEFAAVVEQAVALGAVTQEIRVVDGVEWPAIKVQL